MNEDVKYNNWESLKYIVKHEWNLLTNDDIKQINGSRIKLINKLSEKYKLSPSAAQKMLDQLELQCRDQASEIRAIIQIPSRVHGDNQDHHRERFQDVRSKFPILTGWLKCDKKWYRVFNRLHQISLNSDPFLMLSFIPQSNPSIYLLPRLRYDSAWLGGIVGCFLGGWLALIAALHNLDFSHLEKIYILSICGMALGSVIGFLTRLFILKSRTHVTASNNNDYNKVFNCFHHSIIQGEFYKNAG